MHHKIQKRKVLDGIIYSYEGLSVIYRKDTKGQYKLSSLSYNDMSEREVDIILSEIKEDIEFINNWRAK